MKKITSCRLCGSPNIMEFLNLGNQPLANLLLKNPHEKEEFYPLSLSWCKECSLVQLKHTIEPDKLFSNYVWVTSTSEAAKEHSMAFFKEVTSRAKDLKSSYVLEIASNDGTFLVPFMKNNYKVLGVDPARNIADDAVSRGIPTKCAFFGVKTANEIVKENNAAKVVIARNVLAHVANLHDFVNGLALCMEAGGLLVLEVHYAKIILDELHYDSIYHEHLCYFTLKSLEALLNMHGLYIEDIGKSPISGGSLIVYARNIAAEEKPSVKKYRESEEKSKVNELFSWKNFTERVIVHKKKLLAILAEASKEHGNIIGYGASARSSTLLNYCGINSGFISVIADKNELKHGLYTAGTHILIESPENAMARKPKYVFIMAWNFRDEIIKTLVDRFRYKGRFIVPLPKEPEVFSAA